ncbi:MAG: homocysteine S-methyltransferase family protein, partial [bacterium]
MTTSHRLMDELGRTVLAGSGALGTSLRRAADTAGGPVEILNLRQPAAVRSLHNAYRDAGSQILITNTFGANRLALGDAGLGEQVAAVNEAGVRLAREAAGDAAMVWASAGPLGLGLRFDDFG